MGTTENINARGVLEILTTELLGRSEEFPAPPCEHLHHHGVTEALYCEYKRLHRGVDICACFFNCGLGFFEMLGELIVRTTPHTFGLMHFSLESAKSGHCSSPSA